MTQQAGTHRYRLKRRLDRPAAATYLRQLAASIEEGNLDLEGRPELDVHGEIELEESIKGSSGASRLRVKLQLALVSPADVAPAERGGHQTYRQLKRQMKRDFVALRAALDAGELPAALVRAFHVGCHRMTGHPGKGDPLYPSFNAAADALMAAVERNDLDAARAAVRQLAALRREGHRRYK